ncbi:PREDICTED: acid-sensing ion channel 1-like isoform X1 [Branchiostoma belcheri]|uniref:Acid-sensing ion channel 1-like isoform X1 n=1 Tax=Branchiostoma belcheri TaxID=7741 RepID=A0A6P4YCV7_BRABE|nr:PREDICTED: acid-sensing ion channel 1-like isoform X1 [Branchiostoma belcheri]XP_019626994.1 PREDICTED: acid-sensing ion channel 1-like isoform X1 [Branchiostoma belcheri]XP_019626995.1 PREDICTED: acid-sensing ion channel 1-like isoform X1 [Branchiostoma belcheri]XP_019626996.1 PREDICTED: acid-sensing ion channel 1-like isoform X1 [Branchiostoma belcheri]XP_019626997.1 PREDICTED: acid-sensing ion channel 1-like isoform X1 [Branchiostoma belcheri]
MSPEEDKQSPEKEFVGNTTLHGLNRIVIAPSGYFQALWVLVILGSYAGFAFMFSSMIMDYFRYDTITDTKLKFADAIPFPAVTICNMNKFDSTKLKLVEWSYLSPLLLGKEYSTSELLTLGLQPDETINSSIANISIKDFVLENGFDINQDRMALCYWRNEACSYLNFTHSYTFFGNCFTFNSDKSNMLWQTMEGHGNGMMVFIDIRAEEYTENFFSYGNSEVGLKLLVHDQDEPPQMDAKGIALAPGNHAFITVKRTVYENHGPPWGNCQDLQLEYYDTYTLPACYLECRSKHVVANCSCRPFFLPGTAPFCDPTQIVQCVIRVMAKVTSGELKCNCPVPCSMTKYSTSVSYSGWPNKLTKDYIVRTYSQTKDYMRENGVVFSVFYEQLNYERVRELKAMDGGQLASNIGGMMGLFIGASLLTILEVWEYLWMRLLGCLSKARRPRTRIIQVQVSEKNGGLNNGAFRS